MADTYTANYGLTKPQLLNMDPNWGFKLAGNFDTIDATLYAKADKSGGTLTNPAINGFTGNTSVINIGSGQVYKDTSGNLLLGKTSATANAGDFQLSKGVGFPAAQITCSDPNTLDDYEEGSWTPGLGGTATYTNQYGRYTKVGNVVHFEGRLTVNAIGTGSTSVLSGLPFVSNASLPTGIVRVGYFASCATSVVAIAGMLQGGGASIQFYSQTAAGTAMGVSAIFQGSTDIYFSGTYTV